MITMLKLKCIELVHYLITVTTLIKKFSFFKACKIKIKRHPDNNFKYNSNEKIHLNIKINLFNEFFFKLIQYN